jgi:hypothetical protein
MRSSTTRRPFQWLLAASAFALALGGVNAQDAQSAQAYEPVVGQHGKDVMWVPTGESLVDIMLRMAEVTPRDYLVDLGSGDGRTVITAAQGGTRAHGIEYNPKLVALSRQAAEKAGVADKATFVEGDIFEEDFSDASVVTLFLLPELNQQLRPILLDMKPGTRVVSNSFDMGDWAPDETIQAGAHICRTYCTAYKWTVPAKVEGDWKLGDEGTLSLKQKYQILSGYLDVGGEQHEIRDARMQGKQIAFTANGQRYTGQVDTDKITGQDGAGKQWSAARK